MPGLGRIPPSEEWVFDTDSVRSLTDTGGVVLGAYEQAQKCGRLDQPFGVEANANLLRCPFQ